jgi:hypothetical protein
MTPFVDEPARTVLIADISEEAIEASIRAAILNYNQNHGPLRHVWVNPKDVPGTLVEIEGIPIERKGGCPRRKVMVL